tara:strand:+ start:140687 stop:140983 length:297 start_codon:yes stop_codon:yes gene_type:complete
LIRVAACLEEKTSKIGGVTNPTDCATTNGSIQVSGSGTGIVSLTGTASGTSGSVTLPYTIPNLGAGPYSVTFDQLLMIIQMAMDVLDRLNKILMLGNV